MFKGIYSKGARKLGRIDFANKVVYEGSILESTTKEATSDGSEVQEKKIGVLKKGTIDFERAVTKKTVRQRVASLLRMSSTLYGVERWSEAAKPKYTRLEGLKRGGLKWRMGLDQPNSPKLLQMLSKLGNPLPSPNWREISERSKCEKPPVIAALVIRVPTFFSHRSQDENVKTSKLALPVWSTSKIRLALDQNFQQNQEDPFNLEDCLPLL